MSRPAQLPPRFPVRNSGSSTHIANQISQKNDELQGRHHMIPSQGSFFEDQLAWVGDLLDHRGTCARVAPLRRAISDPVAILEESSTFDFTAYPIDDGAPLPSDTHIDLLNSGDKDDASDDSGCVYGPNSPRRMKHLTQSESSVVSAIFESVNRNPFQYVSVNIPSSSDISEATVKGDNFVASGNFDSEQPLRRHNGQRSRVRKIQYIAELERTVNVFQTLEADLAAKVASLFQQRAVLSLENSNLKQKIASLRKEKMIKDGQYQSLKNEVKKLKANPACHGKSKSASWFPPETIGKESSETNWQALDMGKLSLGENTVNFRHFRS